MHCCRKIFALIKVGDAQPYPQVVIIYIQAQGLLADYNDTVPFLFFKTTVGKLIDSLEIDPCSCLCRNNRQQNKNE